MTSLIKDTEYYYITDEHYTIAKQNGIKELTVHNRVNNLGWSVERAITEKPMQRKSTRWKEFKDISLSNGIGYNTYVTRVHRGMSCELASTLPLIDDKERLKRSLNTNRKYPTEYYEMAKSNGIDTKTFYRRMKSGWSLEDACSLPIVKDMTKRFSVGRKMKCK